MNKRSSDRFPSISAMVLPMWIPALACAFQVTPRSFDVGNVETGVTSAPQIFTITNNTASTMCLGLPRYSAALFGSTTTCPGTLPPGGTCTISYAFSAAAFGMQTTPSHLITAGGIDYSLGFPVRLAA